MHDTRMKATSFRVDAPLPAVNRRYLGGVNSDDDLQRSALSGFGGFSGLDDFSGLGEGFGFFMQASCARPDAAKLD
jgi:hypothetical protein